MTEKASWPSVIFEFLCAAALAAAVPFMLVSAFALEADATAILRSGLFFSLLLALARRREKRYPLVILTLVLIVMVFLWDRSAAVQSFLLATRDVADSILASLKSFSHLESKIAVEEGTTCTRILCILGGLIAFAVSESFSRYWSLLAPIALTWPFLGLCMVQNQRSVAAWTVLVFAGAWVAIILSRNSRNENRPRWQVLLLPAAVFAAIIFVLSSPLSHDRSVIDSLTPAWQQFISDHSPVKATSDGVEFVGIGNRQTLGSEVWNDNVKRADLERVGPMGYPTTRVMSVYSDDDDLIYLRGNSYATYTGTSWDALDESAYASTDTDEGLWVKDGSRTGNLRILTARECSIAYVPFNLTSMPDGMVPWNDAYISNPDRLSEYSMSVHSIVISGTYYRYPLPSGYESFVYQHYMDIPLTTRKYLDGTALSDYVVMSWTDGDLYRVMKAVEEEGKTYSRSTPAMPAGEEDFVTWFLSDCDTGYCVHFASAAVMMFRYLGIPARYVTGFVVSAEAGQWTEVTRSDAHAWVEYYRPGVGWCMYDPTPADSEARVEYHNRPSQQTESYQGGVTGASKSEADPEDTVGMQPFEEKENGLPHWLVRLICIAGAYLLWYFGIKLVRFIQFRRRDPNKRALAIYRWIVVISRLDGVLPPQEATDLALKARFSRDGITDADAREMLHQYDITCERMHIYSEFLRAFVANYILAI